MLFEAGINLRPKPTKATAWVVLTREGTLYFPQRLWPNQTLPKGGTLVCVVTTTLDGVEPLA